MSRRGPWQGMWTISRLNWPFYAAAGVIAAGAALLCRRAPFPGARLLGGGVLAGCAWFLGGSLGVSHWVYDRSDLYRWGWLRRALRGARWERVIVCHAGFDEASESLRERLGTRKWTVLDHFDARRMTEPSIRRARRLFPPVAGTVAAPSDRWPLPAACADAVFGLLAIHELRSEAERAAWFSEAARCLGRGGRIVLAEHVRDLANFAAFGPGFLHFHSRASWRRSWEKAGLRCIDDFRVTPWIRVFVLQPAA